MKKKKWVFPTMSVLPVEEQDVLTGSPQHVDDIDWKDYFDTDFF